MNADTEVGEILRGLDIALDRDLFMRTLIRELSGTLEDVVGLEQASGFISVVGQAMGEWLDRTYKKALGVPSLNREQVAAVLVDLKQRIHGDFRVIEQSDETGGWGANYIIEWKSDKKVNEPIIESVTYGTRGAHSISFISQGRTLSEIPDR